MKFPSYPKYKDSGVEWLGEVPEHWEVKRLKEYGTIKGGTGFPHEYQGVEDEDIPFYKVSDMGNSGNQKFMSAANNTISNQTASFLKADIIPSGSIVYAKIGAALLLNKRRITTTQCCIDNNMSAYIPCELNIDWAYYWYTILDFTTFVNPGAVPSFSEGYQRVLPLLVPSATEQHAIAAFLDAQTSKIDTLIAKKRELIDKLKEKRAALITRAVTRGLPPEAAKAAGLDPNPRMKDSGVEWLGEVPEHWGVSQLKYEIKSGTSITYGIVQAGPDVEDGIPYIRTSDMSGEFFKEDGYPKTSHEIDNSYRRSRVYEGDVVVAIRATVGKALPVPRYLNGANLTQGTAKVSPGRRLMTDFLLHYLASTTATQRFNSLAKGATFKEITLEMLRNFTIPIPPLAEQKQMILYINSKLNLLSTVLSCTEVAIERLQEYRSALITAAVTGKIDITTQRR